ncbi:MAG: hypothetical protein A7316_09375 [Candidatus Altiarchaeales archaeon WOR_SM1_86-2]|nr:MAG: hypothetical protein A7316_09375 [Candidatus Altiarchaeales archaeon WOR_SM1_86-2]ODS41074.1 MAG: hypothetical protein A7315_07080 [Candidatus Altiarchaeales archaeon WOR_SM1_79]
MVNITLSIPEELYKVVKKHSEIKWSEVARRAMWDYAKRLEEMDRIASKSKLTEHDAIEIGEKIKKGIWERHKAQLTE